MEEILDSDLHTRYRLRNWLVSRQRYWGTPIPVINCQKCGQVDVPDEELPVLLPDIEFKQNKPLQADMKLYQTKCPSCGSTDAFYDRDTLDTFVDSSWYFLRFLDNQNKDQVFSKDKAENFMPVDIYVGGMEHAIMHLLYARFFHKFLCDEVGLTQKDSDQKHNIREPFKELIV